MTAFIEAALKGLQPVDDGTVRIIKVKATGHLCNSDGSYAVSSANIEVAPIEARE